MVVFREQATERRGARVLPEPFPLCKWFNCLSDKAKRDLLSVQAVALRPFIGIVIGSEDLIDPGKVDREIFVEAFFLRSMVPVVISRRHETSFQPFRARSEIAVRPGGLKRHKNQIR